jgi:hypothetical protein
VELQRIKSYDLDSMATREFVKKAVQGSNSFVNDQMQAKLEQFTIESQ